MSKISVTPIFIFSLPRAGSTLLQRMLMGHPAIASTSEPWVLLPMTYMLPNEDGEIIGPYDHRLAQQAVSDLVKRLPENEEDYWNAVRGFVTSIYTGLADDGKQYFLDKTPRYYLIITQIRKIFPDAKFIFLFRNPLAVLASIVETWGSGRFGQFYQNHVDLFRGPGLLVEGKNSLGDMAVTVNYENLVSEPDRELGRILGYLGLSHEDMTGDLPGSEKLHGRLGDQTGIRKYAEVTAQSAERWVNTFQSRVRRWYARRYLRTLGSGTLAAMGYESDEIMAVLNNTGRVTAVGFSDAVDLLRVHVYRALVSERSRRALRKLCIPGNLTWKKRGSDK